MKTLTLKKKIVLPATENHVGQFAIMRKSKTSKHMKFSALHPTYQAAQTERQRLKTITENYTFYIVCVINEA